jgi:hypothetical protein
MTGGAIPEGAMTTPTTVPLTITPDAAAYIAELGLQAQFEEMLEHARQTIPGMHSLDVELQPAYDMEFPCILILPTVDEPGVEYDPTEMKYATWKRESFPYEVSQHFTLLLIYRPADAR